MKISLPCSTKNALLFLSLTLSHSFSLSLTISSPRFQAFPCSLPLPLPSRTLLYHQLHAPVAPRRYEIFICMSLTLSALFCSLFSFVGRRFYKMGYILGENGPPAPPPSFPPPSPPSLLPLPSKPDPHWILFCARARFSHYADVGVGVWACARVLARERERESVCACLATCGKGPGLVLLCQASDVRGNQLSQRTGLFAQLQLQLQTTTWSITQFNSLAAHKRTSHLHNLLNFSSTFWSCFEKEKLWVPRWRTKTPAKGQTCFVTGNFLLPPYLRLTSLLRCKTSNHNFSSKMLFEQNFRLS